MTTSFDASGKAAAKGKPTDSELATNALNRQTLASGGAITPEERWNMIAVAAYYHAEQRGFMGGNPAEDWVAAEEEIDALLNGNH